MKPQFNWTKYNESFERLGYKYKPELLATIQILKPNSILEVGSGLNRMKKYIPKNINYTGIDLITGHDITKIEPFSFFNLVLCLGVLCHIPVKKRKKAIAFMKASGRYVLMIEPYDTKEVMHYWHNKKNFLWTVNPEKYNPKIFRILDGGYSLTIL